MSFLPCIFPSHHPSATSSAASMTSHSIWEMSPNESLSLSLNLSPDLDVGHLIWMLKMFELMAMFRWVPLFFDPCLSRKGFKLSWWDVSVRFSSQRMRVMMRMMRMSTTRVLRRAVATKLVVTVAIFFIRLRTFGLCWNCSVSLRYGW